MIFIEHRRNKISDLDLVGAEHGVEIDIRSCPSTRTLIAAHEPFEMGDPLNKWFEKFIKNGVQGPVIFNTKEDGLESVISEMAKGYGISNFYFLDTTIPTLVKNISQENGRSFMARLSSYEPWEQVFKWKTEIEWLWVDCFHGIPLDRNILEEASKDFKLCLVSPELHGFPLISKIDQFSSYASYFSAICTKETDFWKAHL